LWSLYIQLDSLRFSDKWNTGLVRCIDELGVTHTGSSRSSSPPMILLLVHFCTVRDLAIQWQLPFGGRKHSRCFVYTENSSN